MGISDLLVKAAELMAIGMFVVYAFLGVLVLLTKWLSVVVAKYQKPQIAAVPTCPALPQGRGAIDPRTVAAIGAAIHQHRQSKK